MRQNWISNEELKVEKRGRGDRISRSKDSDDSDNGSMTVGHASDQ